MHETIDCQPDGGFDMLFTHHLHVHALPRWGGDTNFMTVVAETRILPEMLSDSWKRLRQALAEEVPE
jgi:diadenosine tetraphosphate (Ap4A) HIT family hydrolase